MPLSDVQSLWPASQRHTLWGRLLLGVLQGVLLYFLYRLHDDRDLIFKGLPLLNWQGSAWLVVMVLPILAMLVLGQMQGKLMVGWLGLATLVLAALGYHEVWHQGPDVQTVFPAMALLPASAGFWLLQIVVLAMAQEQRRWPSYTRIFAIGSHQALQMVLAQVFSGLVWLMLWLAASLFELVQQGFLSHLIEKPWFFLPFGCLNFACALHLCERPAAWLAKARNLGQLLGWMLFPAVVSVGAFLLILPWTGLAPLWATRHASSLLLVTALWLVLLINSVFRDGTTLDEIPRFLRWALRLAALLGLPITFIACYALGLRVQDYGWTVDRLYALACLLLAGWFVLGYSWAALSRRRPFAAIAAVNQGAVWLVAALLVLIFTPLADPARLSVADQMARLRDGRLSPDMFDFHYLDREGGRYGKAALVELEQWQEGPQAALIRQRAKERAEGGANTKKELVDLAVNLSVWPAGKELPKSFLSQKWEEQDWTTPQCLREANQHCDAFQIDFNADGHKEILLLSRLSYGRSVILMDNGLGHWQSVASLKGNFSECPRLLDHLKAGQFRLAPPVAPLQLIEIGGKKLPVEEERVPDDRTAVDCADLPDSSVASKPAGR